MSAPCIADRQKDRLDNEALARRNQHRTLPELQRIHLRTTAHST